MLTMFESEDVRDWWHRINLAWKYNARQIYGITTQDLIIFFAIAAGVVLVFVLCCACCEICDACLDPEPSTGWFLYVLNTTLKGFQVDAYQVALYVFPTVVRGHAREIQYLRVS